MDNQILEPADTFYKDSGAEELEQPTETPEVAQEEAPEVTSEESDSADDEQESQFIELDGEEIDLEDVRQWKNGHMMQSDYTKKTQALAEERKTFEAERDSERETLLKEKTQISDMRDMLEVLVAEDDEIDWAELKELEPERYIELKEKADKRKQALEKVKAERQTPADDPALIIQEQKKFFSYDPEWFDGEGKPTEKYSKDMSLLETYAMKAGFDANEFSQMTRAHYLTTILKAAKYDQLQEKGREIKEKRSKVPVVTKPKAAVKKAGPKQMHEVFYSS